VHVTRKHPIHHELTDAETFASGWPDRGICDDTGDVPSPIGHALGGAAVAWAADVVSARRRPARVALLCGAVAMLPDLDLLLPVRHRTFTHSAGAVGIVMIIAAAVTAWVTRRARGRSSGPGTAARVVMPGTWTIAILCGSAYASHILFDWLGADNSPPFGVQAWWPFSHDWYLSGLNVFRVTERRHFLSAATLLINAKAIGQELLLLGALLLVVWLVREKTLPRFASEPTRRDHPPQ